MITINAYVSDRNEHAGAPGTTVRRLRISPLPATKDQVLEPKTGSMAIDLNQPLESVFSQFKSGQKVKITIEPQE